MKNINLSHFKNNWLHYTLLFLLIAISSFMWISKNKALSKQQIVFLEEQSKQQQTAQNALDSINAGQIKVMITSLVWAVRSELVRENNEQVDQYFRQFVKTKAVQDVTLIDGTGKVQLSTNRKIEGSIWEADYLEQALTTDDVTIIDEGSDDLHIIGPIMSLNNRLGTLIVRYSRPKIPYKIQEDIMQQGDE